LVYANSPIEAKEYVEKGYEPVECSFGNSSIVGPCVLDHHGEYSDEEPVSIKAAKIALQSNFSPYTRWVVTGMPDSDAIYTILVLSGLIIPDMEIATCIGELDLDPIGIDRTRGGYLRDVLFQSTGPKTNSQQGFIDACNVGMAVFNPGQMSNALLDSAVEYEITRIQNARGAMKQLSSCGIMLVESSDASRDVWHAIAPLVVQFKPHQQVITFSGCSLAGANRLQVKSIFDVLGPSGLTALYPVLGLLLGGECGGRPDIGGSPRGLTMSFHKAEQTYRFLEFFLKCLHEE